jgi:hypothetical protein
MRREEKEMGRTPSKDLVLKSGITGRNFLFGAADKITWPRFVSYLYKIQTSLLRVARNYTHMNFKKK